MFGRNNALKRRVKLLEDANNKFYHRIFELEVKALVTEYQDKVDAKLSCVNGVLIILPLEDEEYRYAYDIGPMRDTLNTLHTEYLTKRKACDASPKKCSSECNGEKS